MPDVGGDDLRLTNAPPPVHIGNLRDASFVETTRFTSVRRLLQMVIRTRTAGLIQGEPGLGKTTVVRYLLHQDQTPFAEVSFADTPHRRESISAIHEALVGMPAVGTAGAIERSLRKVVRERDVVLVVDEVETLSAIRLATLRKLQDVVGTRLAIVFVGDLTAAERIKADPRFDDRILSSITFRPMNLDAVRRYVPRYHAVYRDVEPRRLRRLHEEVWRGSWRAIARYTLCLETVCSERGDSRLRLDDESEAKATALVWDSDALTDA